MFYYSLSDNPAVCVNYNLSDKTSHLNVFKLAHILRLNNVWLDHPLIVYF